MPTSKGYGVRPPSDPYDFVDDDSLSQADQSDQVDALVEWFHFNFEDPAEMTPYISAEGGYQYIWGGPFDASEELAERFSDVVPEEAIEEAVDRVHVSGFEWVPASRRIQPEEEGDEQDEEENAPASVDDLRTEMLQRLEDLDATVEALKESFKEPHGGIGHNNPPEPIDNLPLELANAIHQAILVIREESANQSPSTRQVEGAAGQLQIAAAKIISWIGQKSNLAVEEFIKSFSNATGKLLAAGVSAAAVAHILDLPEKLSAAATAALNWIHAVAPLF